MREKTTTLDIARRAGVSRTTVSFILNNTPGKNISEETRQKVLQAVEELDYLPNETARSLAMRKHRSIALCICYNHYLFSDAYVIRLVEGMTPVLNKHRVQLVIQSLRLSQSNYLELAERDDVEGIILFNTHDNDEGLSELVKSNFPVVAIGSIAEGTILQVDIDNRQAAHRATSHLLELGHRRIAMIVHAPMVYYAAKHRQLGYRQALEEAGITYRKELVRTAGFSEASGKEEMQELLKAKPLPTAVFAGNDTVGYGALQAVREAGLTVPEDISILGFDDNLLSRYLNPPLTTMSVPASALGGTAARQLIDMLNGKPPPEKRRIILPTHLAIRSSCKKMEAEGRQG